MSYEVDYGPIIEEQGEEAAARKGVLDAVRFLGQEKSRVIYRAIIEGVDEKQILMLMRIIAGVDGYPARMLYARAKARRV